MMYAHQVDVCICHNQDDISMLENFQEKLISYGFRVLLQRIDDTENDISSINTRTLLLVASSGNENLWHYSGVIPQLEEQATHGVNISIILIPGSIDDFDNLPPILERASIIDIATEDRVNWHRFFIEIMEVSKVLETSRAIITDGASKRSEHPPQNLDEIAMAAIKSQLHTLSELVATDASQAAAYASQTYPHDALTMLIPLVIELRWRRGYRKGLERILNVPEPNRYLRDFKIAEFDPPCKVDQGVLSAQLEEDGNVTIFLGNFSAVVVSRVKDADAELIVNTIEDFGRLPRDKTGELALIDRIRAIPLQGVSENKDEIARALYRNRDVLIPLLSRYRIPGIEWLSDDEKYLEQRRAYIQNAFNDGMHPSDDKQLPDFALAKESIFEANNPHNSLFRSRTVGRKKR